MTSSGDLWLSGVVDGAITNNGGTVHVYAPLSGVTSFVNNGGTLDMDDGVADGVLHARSWSGSGTQTAYFDFAPALDESDHVVLSGDYGAATDINLVMVGPSGRRLGEMPLIVVGGANTGTVTVSGLPDDGVITYRLARSKTGWVIAAGVNEAPGHVADALGLVGDAVNSVTEVPLDQAGTCGRGGWMKGLGATHAEDLAGADADLGFGGLELGYDIPCLGSGAGPRIGGGLMLGAVQGNIAMRSAGDDSFSSAFTQGFVGAYGTLAEGSLHAILQGKVGFGSYSLADPGALITAATLESTRVDLDGDASYDLAFGAATLAPELGFAASESSSSSNNFADLGKMNLSTTPTVDVHAGAKLSGDLSLGSATTISPFASVSFHHALVAPPTATVMDSFGDTAPAAISQVGDYVAVGLGLDLVRTPGMAGTGIDAGLRANLRYGENISDTSVSGHLDLQF
jgi:outer membrane autotransporter protein